MSTPALPLDPDLVRAQFPAFAEPGLMDQAFFENAGGSYTAAQVLDRLDHYYRATKVQPYGPYPASQEAGAAMDLAYERMAAALGVSADWIHFGTSTSANTYVLAHAFAQSLQPGDVIIVTNQDHEANSGPWRRLSDRGITVREWRVAPETGHLDPADLDALLDARVRLVAFPHVSNIVGEINPVKSVCTRIHQAGAIAVVDGVSYAPHGLPDLTELGADIYLFSAYKTYGPHQGVMAVRPDLARSLPNQGHFFNDGKPRYRLTPAGPDHAQIAAAAGIVDYLERVAEIAGDAVAGPTPFHRAHAAMQAQEKALMAPLIDFVHGTNRARLIGPTDPDLRAPTFALRLPGNALDAARKLAEDGIMAGAGHFYAWRLLEALGIDQNQGVLRLSFTHYTSPEDIDALIAALDRVLG